MKLQRKSMVSLIISMILFGTIGLFVSNISLSSSVIALMRAVGGFLFLLSVVFIKRERLAITAIGKNLLWLCLSGTFLGFNWILLFEAYRYTSVAVATLCYYMAPIFVVIASPFILKEKLSAQKVICIGVSLIGMVLISGIFPQGIQELTELTGILLGLSAAALYASITLLNKKMVGLPAYDRTLFQLGFSGVIMLLYCLLTTDIFAALSGLDMTGWLLLTIVVIVHTGISYYLYFGSLSNLPAQSIAMISYIDPVVAIICSVVIMLQIPTLGEGIGAILILCAAVFSELSFGKQVK